MRLEDIKNIAVIGGGIMGHGIAQTYAMGGYRVRLRLRQMKLENLGRIVSFVTELLKGKK